MTDKEDKPVTDGEKHDGHKSHKSLEEIAREEFSDVHILGEDDMVEHFGPIGEDKQSREKDGGAKSR